MADRKSVALFDDHSRTEKATALQKFCQWASKEGLSSGTYIIQNTRDLLGQIPLTSKG